MNCDECQQPIGDGEARIIFARVVGDPDSDPLRLLHRGECEERFGRPEAV